MAGMQQKRTSKVRTLSGGLLLAIAYVGFVSLGLPDPVAGVAWPSVRDEFGLTQSHFGLVFIALGCGYCASGFFGGKLTQWLGLGNLLWVSSGFVALAMVGSGIAPGWLLFVPWAIVWGLGSGGIDAGLNAYASRHFSAKHVNWLHACYSVGATLGPLVMTAMLVRLGSWRLGYAVVGGALMLMTVIFFATRHAWNDPVPASGEEAQAPIGLRAALREKMVWLQIVIFFLYVGLEFAVGQWSFTLLTESRKVPENVAGMLAAGYFAAIGVGRVLAGFIAHRVGLDPLIRFSMLGVVLGSLLLAFGSPVQLGNAGLAIMGLGLAAIFPSLMARTPERLGREYVAHAAGFQVSAGMLGAALLPGLAGMLVERRGLESVASLAVVLAVILFATHEYLLVVARRRRASAEPAATG
jgi:fucose permease